MKKTQLNKTYKVDESFVVKMKIIKLMESINLSNTIKLIGDLFKKTLITSVNFNGLYHEEFNFYKYLICYLNLLIMIIGFLLIFLIINFDPLFHLIDNQFLPKDAKILLVALLVLIFHSIAFRIDVIADEWKNHLSFFKIFYYLQEDIKSRHGLTEENYKKISILSNFLNIMLIKGSIPAIALSLILVVIYIAIRANKLPFYLFTLLFIYLAFMVASTFILLGSMAILTLYYFKLLFDQINDKIEAIYLNYTKSDKIITAKDQKRLFKLIKEHDLKAQDIKRLNQMVSLTCLVFFLVLSLMQIIPLNLFLQTHVWYQQIIYLIYLISTLGFGFGAHLVYSIQINSAHKPYKIIYKILIRQKLKLKFKLKVF